VPETGLNGLHGLAVTFTGERVPGANYIVGGNEAAISRGLNAAVF
jgi:hypothetical protein